jgi:hypothetical protein
VLFIDTKSRICYNTKAPQKLFQNTGRTKAVLSLFASMFVVLTFGLTVCWVVAIPRLLTLVKQIRGLNPPRNWVSLQWEVSATIIITVIALAMDSLAGLSSRQVLTGVFLIWLVPLLLFPIYSGEPGTESLETENTKQSRLAPIAILFSILLLIYLWATSIRIM